MNKIIDFSKTIYELSKEHEEFVGIMKELGFTEISKPVMLSSVGKIMTLPKGAKMKNIPLDRIVEVFAQRGFKCVGEEVDNLAIKASPAEDESAAGKDGGCGSETSTDRVEQIKNYLRRLSSGEDLDSVRADFVKHFSDVEAAEIMHAEQELLEEGTPLDEVQQLCDVHSALFHGSTREEQIMNAEIEVEASLRRMEAAADKTLLLQNYISTKGHLLNILSLENKEIAATVEQIREKCKQGQSISEELVFLREIAIHYAKKGDLIYPLLKTKYNVTGPQNVMWTVDDEIRSELSELVKQMDQDRLEAVLCRIEEMIYKEENILFPICVDNFQHAEWIQLYRDSKDYAVCMGVEKAQWDEAENMKHASDVAVSGEMIHLPGGHLTVEQLRALLNIIPMEITFVDAEDINCFFNEGPKVFKRPQMAIDRDVFSCHPPKIEMMVRQIISDFRSGTRSQIEIWMEKENRPMLVKYMAVRDDSGKYLGTVELVQDMEFAREHFLGNK